MYVHFHHSKLENNSRPRSLFTQVQEGLESSIKKFISSYMSRKYLANSDNIF